MVWKLFNKKKTGNSSDNPAEQPSEQSDDNAVSEPQPPEPEKGPSSPPPSETVSSPIKADPSEMEPDADEKEQTGGFFTRLKRGLSKTRQKFSSGFESLFSGKNVIDDDLLEDLEELLITSDIGVHTTMTLLDRISGKAHEITDSSQLKAVLKQEALTFFEDEMPPPSGDTTAKPYVVMVVGVNGVGKTTTIGKLAARYAASGKKVLIAAADTFRAAAVEQLSVWAERAGADIVKHKENADPAAVAFDAVDAAIARDTDIVLIDTAGRLHTRVNLMEELKKIRRSVSKRLQDAPHEILLVLDATTGQNALSQANLFHEALDVTGIALTKLDGTAKGGIVLSIRDALKIPLTYVGVGETIEDLQRFDAKQFINALF